VYFGDHYSNITELKLKPYQKFPTLRYVIAGGSKGFGSLKPMIFEIVKINSWHGLIGPGSGTMSKILAIQCYLINPVCFVLWYQPLYRTEKGCKPRIYWDLS
jgi:hypothetical protein